MVLASRRVNLKGAGELLWLPLGDNKFVKESRVCYPERLGFGVTIIGALPRYGKTIVVKNAYAQIGQFRPVIILDYLGEHSTSKYPNFLSRNQTMCLPGLVEFRLGDAPSDGRQETIYFKFKISQFRTAEDWFSLGFTEKTSLLMADLARAKDAHRDDPDVFKEMLEDLPLSPGEVGGFEKRWGFRLTKVNQFVYDHANTIYQYLHRESFFAVADSAEIDFGDIALKYRYVNINFQLNETEKNKARAVAGKALEQIERVLDRFVIKPLIVVEEADVIAPNYHGESGVVSTSSGTILLKFVLKLQKKGMEIWFVVQDPKQLHPSIWANAHIKILGQLPEGNQHEEVTRKLEWDADKNYREFAMFRKGKSGYEVFIPLDSCTLY